MYVRNYGLPPKTAKREGEPTLSRSISAVSPTESEQDDSVKADSTAPLSTQKEDIEPTEQPNATAFGENGIPPQKLRRRRLPKKEKGELLPQITESTAATPLPKEEGELRQINEAEERKPIKRKAEVPFSTEDMLLGGLLLLLIGERAADDVVIALAFLLFSGFKLK